jgi:hypothetical protein
MFVSTMPGSTPPAPEKPAPPIQEEALDKMIGLLEGPVNKVSEKILGSTLVLAPLSLMMSLSFRTLAFFMGRDRSQQ